MVFGEKLEADGLRMISFLMDVLMNKIVSEKKKYKSR